MKNTVRELEEDGWEVLSEAPLEARREWGERVEIVRAGHDGRFRYTVTSPLGEEEFRRVSVGDSQCRVVSRNYRETTVTGELQDMSLLAALAAAIQAARA